VSTRGHEHQPQPRAKALIPRTLTGHAELQLPSPGRCGGCAAAGFEHAAGVSLVGEARTRLSEPALSTHRVESASSASAPASGTTAGSPKGAVRGQPTRSLRNGLSKT
jgi:hypothetical protein